jgi:hypothetical protein
MWTVMACYRNGYTFLRLVLENRYFIDGKLNSLITRCDNVIPGMAL